VCFECVISAWKLAGKCLLAIQECSFLCNVERGRPFGPYVIFNVSVTPTFSRCRDYCQLYTKSRKIICNSFGNNVTRYQDGVKAGELLEKKESKKFNFRDALRSAYRSKMQPPSSKMSRWSPFYRIQPIHVHSTGKWLRNLVKGVYYSIFNTIFQDPRHETFSLNPS